MFFGNALRRGTLVSSPFGSTLRHGRQYVAGVEHLEHGPYAVERDGSRADEVISVDLDWCAYLATRCLTSVRVIMTILRATRTWLEMATSPFFSTAATLRIPTQCVSKCGQR